MAAASQIAVPSQDFDFRKLQELVQTPGRAGLTLFDDWMQHSPDSFSRAACKFIQFASSAEQATLIRLIGNSERQTTLLLDQRVPLSVAQDLFGRLVDLQPALAHRLVAVADSHPPSELLRRVVSLIGAITDSETIATLARKLLSHPDPHVHSKANVLFGKGNENPDRLAHWVKDQLRNEDGRVRANAVESLWNKPSDRARQVFRECLGDTHTRVRVNALIGLNYLGEIGALPMIMEMSRSPLPDRRAAAAFAMGQTLLEEFLPRLVELIEDRDPSVRRMAFRSMLRIQTSRNRAK